MKINDYVDVPDDMQIPEGTRVRNLITGENFRQPAEKRHDPTTDAAQFQGTWNVVEMQQIGYEPSNDEREIYKSGGYKITFTKNKMIHSPDHSSGEYRVDTTQTPHVLEFSQSGRIIAKAIFELTADDLKICQGRTPTDGSDPEPPTSFDINQAPSKFPTLMILRRTNPIEPIAIPLGVAAPDAATGARASGPIGKQKGATKPKRLQIREATVVDASAASSQQSDDSNIVEFSGMRLRLNPAQPAVLTEDDIMTVESVTDPNNPKASQIVLTLTQEAGERFLIETTRLSSQPNPGYLVIKFDGTVLSAPRVLDKISSKVAISFAERDKLNMERVVCAIRESIATREKVAKKEPEVIAPDAPAHMPRIESVVVGISKDGEISLNRKKMSLAELKTRAGRNAKKWFRIQADEDVHYSKVVEVVEALKAVGVTEISVEALKAVGVTEISFAEARVGKADPPDDSVPPIQPQPEQGGEQPIKTIPVTSKELSGIWYGATDRTGVVVRFIGRESRIKGTQGVVSGKWVVNVVDVPHY